MFDLIIAGGGIAGVCCAIRAAREGLKTALFEARPLLGGNASDERAVIPSGGVTFRPFMMETGLIGDMLLEQRAYGETLSQTLKRWALSEQKLTIFLDEPVSRVCVRDGRIESANSREAKYFADCTGDSALARLAGARVRYGREGFIEFGESLAPDLPDDSVMGTTILFNALKRDIEMRFTPAPDALFYKDINSISPYCRPHAPNGCEYTGFYWLELSEPLHTVNDEAALERELIRHVDGIWDMLKNRSPYSRALSNFELVWRSLPAKRESFRVLARKTLTENDIRYNRYSEDGAATAGWYIDLHKPGAFLTREPLVRDHADEVYKNRAYTAPFNVPLSALHSLDIDNLWMAGRNIGVTHVALGAVRVMNTLANLGEAVAVACAGARDVRGALALKDIRILGATAFDAMDMAQTARASASSAAVLSDLPPDDTRSEPLDAPQAQVFPMTDGYLNEICAYVDGSGRVEWELSRAIDLWDNFSHAPIIGGCALVADGRVIIKIDRRLPEGAYRLSLRGVSASWRRAKFKPTGVSAQYYHPEAAVWNQNRGDHFAFAMRISPAQSAYAPRFALNGKRHPEALPNLWRTDARAADYTLEWDEPVEISRVELTLDTDLNLDWARESPTRARRVAVSTDAGSGQAIENPIGRRLTLSLPPGRARRVIISLTGERIGIYNISVF